MERDGLLVGPYETGEKMKLCDDWYKNGVDSGKLNPSSPGKIQIRTRCNILV